MNEKNDDWWLKAMRETPSFYAIGKNKVLILEWMQPYEYRGWWILSLSRPEWVYPLYDGAGYLELFKEMESWEGYGCSYCLGVNLGKKLGLKFAKNKFNRLVDEYNLKIVKSYWCSSYDEYIKMYG